MKRKNLKEDITEADVDGTIVYRDSLRGYVVTEQPEEDGMSLYTIYDDLSGYWCDEFTDLSLSEEDKKNFEKSKLFNIYLDVVDSLEYGYYDDDEFTKTKSKDNREVDYDFTRDDDSWLDKWSSKYNKYELKPLSPEEQAAEKKKQDELVETLCKSDTIVFHQTDPTTVMLDPIYEGKGWDVYKGSEWSGPLDVEHIHELIKRHEKIVCLGHGTPRGLLSGIIGEDEVPLLKDKKIFSMWCYAATFWKKNGFQGHGILTSDNFPSEVWECKSACNANVSSDWIFDNMMLAGEVAGKAIDISWEDPEAACELFRKEYSEQSKITTEDERKVVDFNTNSMQVV